ncbi:peptidylprolyl isomerase [Dactylosporangium roseum]|uniref:Peptidylprolyl isomerase n=1 Tax=Dactylosporangium roseum TaxID=47989 RepID=A0ABY5YYX3_9ACTN|nr:peptidylprolyl isomerase [Dactylosporangium roseum]UWZ34955.1 peptidylprolyl isomerase [Dactylosporangium roseum]
MASSKARQRALARAKTERQIARRAAAARRRRQWQAGIGSAVALALLVLVVIWKTGGFDPEPVRASDCAWTPVEQGAGIVDVGKPRTTGVLKNGVKTMTITLGQGTVTARLDPSKAPCTVESFTYLAGKKFFDNTTCHRLTDAILQCGDPSNSGSGGPAYRFPNENVPSPTVDPSAAADPNASAPATGNALYPIGTLAMAHSSAPDSNGSQFFLVFKDVQYPADYTVFGTIVGGLDVLQKIAAAGNDGSNQAGGGKPNQDTKISTLTVTDTDPGEPSAAPSASANPPASAPASPAASASSKS